MRALAAGQNIGCLLTLAGGKGSGSSDALAGGRLVCPFVCLRGVRTDIGSAIARKRVGVTSDLLQSIAPDCAARWLKVFYSMDRIVTVSTSFERTIATLALPRWHDICKEPTKAKCCAPVVGSATIAWW